ncbi:MAG TPA: hypothetical protein DDW76_07145 [Cyanobacteria bacterium UBA11369]|nr:hypothetical protein [Cyanobacteria bacterium UBA11371]HBE30391.1 hypothetical protein [Cyanobacteria bacterium UBA11368]HBE48569.1 hypothetical protein [Cyanobacteria bacterium UBA11369]
MKIVDLRSRSVPKLKLSLISLTFGGHNPMEMVLGLLAIVVGTLMLEETKPKKKEEPKEELLYKIEVKKPK